jgi:hypothetical protein
MGCDIHIVLERRHGDEWLGIWSSDCGPRKDGRALVARRNYAFFAKLGVRGASGTTKIWPRNVPVDVSRLAWLQYMKAPTDYHSASYATIDEFCSAWLEANPDSDQVRPQHASYDLLGFFGDEDEGEHRLVFWFDN